MANKDHRRNKCSSTTLSAAEKAVAEVSCSPTSSVAAQISKLSDDDPAKPRKSKINDLDQPATKVQNVKLDATSTPSTINYQLPPPGLKMWDPYHPPPLKCENIDSRHRPSQSDNHVTDHQSSIMNKAIAASAVLKLNETSPVPTGNETIGSSYSKMNDITTSSSYSKNIDQITIATDSKMSNPSTASPGLKLKLLHRTFIIKTPPRLTRK